MNTNHGFTLIELVVTMAVLIVLLVIGVPEFKRMTEGNRQVAAINAIVGDLNLARTEAVKGGRVITVCGSNDGATCNTTNWESGWIVFTDINRNTAVDAGAGDILISRNDGLPAGLTLRSVQFDNADVLQYLPNGELLDASGDGVDDGTFIVCDTRVKDTTRARAANVTRLGRVAIARDTDSDNIRNDVTDNNVTCP